MAVLLRLRRTLPILLHCRFLSTSNSGGVGVGSDSSNPFHSFHGEVIRDRSPYAPDPRLPTFLFESYYPNTKPASISFVSSKQIDKKSKQLTVSLLSLRDRYTSDARALSEMFKSRQAFLNDKINSLNPPPSMMVKEHELSGQLTSSRLSKRLTSLQVMINIFSEIRRQRQKEENEISDELCIKNFSSQIPQIPTTRVSVPVRENKWNEINERWNELNERQMRLKEIESNYPGLPQKLHTSKTLMILKEMLLTEDELAAFSTNSRLASLEEIINNLSEIRLWTSVLLPLDEGHRKMWDELNDGLMRLREMEVGDAILLAVRSDNELTYLSQSIKDLSDYCRRISLRHGFYK